MQNINQMLGLEQAEDQQQAKCLKECFLRDAIGQRALEYLLLELKFLEPCETEGDMALNNTAKDILAMVYGERISSSGILWFIKRMLKRKQRKVTK